MRPTGRGVAVLAIAGTAVVLGARFGQPGLDAVAGPLFAAVLAGAGQVYLAGEPTVERDPPRRGFPGETRTVDLDVDGGGVGRITDRLPDSVGGDVTVERSLPAAVSYDLTYESRGVHRFGPVDVTVTDALGLVRRTDTVNESDEVLVYPSVYRLGGPETFAQTLVPASDDRQAFDRLREYVPGDSLRDVHWKSSAKRDDLLVKEFATRRSDRGLLIVGEATEGRADEMATAVATIAMGAMEAGMAVELAVPTERVERGFGDRHRTRLLEALARTDAGETERAADADVLVTAGDAGVSISVDDRRQWFEDVTASRDNPLAGEVTG